MVISHREVQIGIKVVIKVISKVVTHGIVYWINKPFRGNIRIRSAPPMKRVRRPHTPSLGIPPYGNSNPVVQIRHLVRLGKNQVGEYGSGILTINDPIGIGVHLGKDGL